MSSSWTSEVGRGARAVLRQRCGVLLVAVLVWLWSPAARADTVAVVPFTGPRAAKFERGVVEALKKQHRVVSSARYRKTARKLGAKRPTGKNVARVARKLGARVVVMGAVKRRRGRYELTVWLRSGQTGELLSTLEFFAKKPALPRAGRNKVQLEVASLGSGGARDRDEPDTAQPEPAEEPRVAARPQAQAADEELPKQSAGPGDDDAGVIAAAAPVRSPGPVATVAGGLSVSARILVFTVAPGIANAPQNYRGTPVAGAYVDAALYPLKPLVGSGSWLGRVAVTGSVDRVLRIRSRFDYDDPQTGLRQQAELASTQMRWGLGVRVEHRLGPARVTAGLGYGRLTFSIDKAAAPPGAVVDVPDVEYAYLDPGAGVYLPLAGGLAVALTGRFLWVLDTGEMADPAWYGTAGVYGYDVDAALEYVLGPRWNLRVGGRLLNIAYSFDGTGDAAILRDQDAATLDVPSAGDRYLGGYLTAGYQF